MLEVHRGAATVRGFTVEADGAIRVVLTNGNVIDSTVVDPNITFVSGSNFEYYDVLSPTPGLWHMDITGVSVPDTGEAYIVSVAVDADVTMAMFFDRDQYHLGEPIKVSVSLSDRVSPITGATVVVEVTPPGGSRAAMVNYVDGLRTSPGKKSPLDIPDFSTWVEFNGDLVPPDSPAVTRSAATRSPSTPIVLYDDGLHGDGAANDGVYAAFYTETTVSGSYTFTAYVSGQTNTGEDFTREMEQATYVTSAPSNLLVVSPSSGDLGTLNSGEATSEDFTVSSNLSYDEMVTLTATNLVDAVGNIIPAGQVTFDQDQIVVPAGASQTFSATVTIPGDAVSGDYTGQLTLSSSATTILVPLNVSVVRVWEYAFEDSIRGTWLGADTSLQAFQFTTPGKDFGSRYALNMQRTDAGLRFSNTDAELGIRARAMPQSDFCVALAGDWQARESYLLIDPPGVESSRQAPQPSAEAWVLPLIARAGEAEDSATVLGVLPADLVSCEEGRFALENMASPGVDVYLVDAPGEAQGYAVDLRSAGQQQYTWDFVVRTNQPNAEVLLSWPDLRWTPPDYQLTLVDLDSQTSRLLRTSQHYAYRTGPAPEQRHFQLIAEPKTGGSLQVTSFTATPSRGGGMTFAYGVSREAEVTMRICSTSGQPVCLVAQASPTRAGTNTLTWDGHDAQGRPVPNGVYLCEIVARTEDGDQVRAVRAVRIAR